MNVFMRRFFFANGQIAAEAVARSAADGHTRFITTNTSQAANPSLYRIAPE
jgi:hypothetical protein